LSFITGLLQFFVLRNKKNEKERKNNYMKRLWEYRYIFRYAFARILFLAHAFLVYQKVTG